MSVLFTSVPQFKSSLYEIARNVLRSRNHHAQLREQQAGQILELKQRNEQINKEALHNKELLTQARQELQLMKNEIEELRKQPIRLPCDLPLPHHTYGPKMISLTLNLCKQIGFRPTQAAITTIFNWLGIDAKVPSWDSIRSWACRVGVAQLNQVPQSENDMIWMADHSNQIGNEKVLQILGIAASKLPPPGQTLRREDLCVLAVVPGKDCKRQDVRLVYKKLVERIGYPAALLTDGAVELFESADVLQKPGKKLVVLRDMKHVAANIFEKLVGKDERFIEYNAKLGSTRSRIQQTELGHFNPPPQKVKARFMNLGPVLRWGLMVSYHLRHPHSKARKDIQVSRMNDKLGWVREYADDLAAWHRCEQVMQRSLQYMNRNGLTRQSSEELQKNLDEFIGNWASGCELSGKMACALIDFVRESGKSLGEGERYWISTENLESAFGMYKELEGQHSKGGFTSLLAAMPMLMTDCTPEIVRDRLGTTSVKQLKAWLAKHLPTTLASKRATAYTESRMPTLV